MIPLVERRLRSQRLVGDGCKRISDVVSWLVAVQAQDYALAKWAVGMRVRGGATDDDLERAFANGSILRTHVLRPTWHFVAPADIRWLLTLTAPRVHRINAGVYRKLELDAAVLRRSDRALVRALGGHRFRDRAELREIFQRAGIRTSGKVRLSYLLMHAELEGLVCSGPRRGRQFTYALLDERAAPAKAVRRDDAIVELVRRFFSSRGPATVHDFAKWSGLTLGDARLGLEGAGRTLAAEVIDGRTHWFAARAEPQRARRASTAHLLSIYDEYLSGYKDRRAIIDASHAARLRAMGGALTAIIIVDGRVVGTWNRRMEKTVSVSVNSFLRVTPAQQAAIGSAIRKFSAFYQR